MKIRERYRGGVRLWSNFASATSGEEEGKREAK